MITIIITLWRRWCDVASVQSKNLCVQIPNLNSFQKQATTTHKKTLNNIINVQAAEYLIKWNDIWTAPIQMQATFFSLVHNNVDDHFNYMFYNMYTNGWDTIYTEFYSIISINRTPCRRRRDAVKSRCRKLFFVAKKNLLPAMISTLQKHKLLTIYICVWFRSYKLRLE